MKCPFCAVLETKVVDSRMNQQGDLTRRRRECLECGGRFTTYERIEEIMPFVLKKDGRRELFSREKIASGIEKSCQKLQVSPLEREAVLKRIESRIQGLGVKEVPSKSIGKIVMNELRALNKVAYVRFASVYRDFTDLDAFFQELRDEDSPSVSSDPSFPFVNPDFGVESK